MIGNPDNEVLPTHPLYNIPPKAVITSYIYAQENAKESQDELINGDCGTETETETVHNITTVELPLNDSVEYELL